MKMLPHDRTARSWRKRQRGAVAILVGLLMVVLIGFIGLALDGGHLYLTKTELQNGADACALAASYELTGKLDSDSDPLFNVAIKAGKYLGTKNRVDFQSTEIAEADISVQFSDRLKGGVWGAPFAHAKYVRCTISKEGITPWFMQVLGFGPQTVAAMATASLQNSQTTCAVPMALCTKGSDANYGYVKGNWSRLDYSDEIGNVNLSGNKRWIDFTPNEDSPNCPSGEVPELRCLLEGPGQCQVPAATENPCPKKGAPHQPEGCVGVVGDKNGIEAAYNTRFGLYKLDTGFPQPTTAFPDKSGYAYAEQNWITKKDAYDDFINVKRKNNVPNQGWPGTDPANYDGYTALGNLTKPKLSTIGADRRVVTVPIVDCSNFETGGTYAPVRAYACVLLLDPYRLDGGVLLTQFEYLGLAGETKACSGSGVSGDSHSLGPLVPTLVQ